MIDVRIPVAKFYRILRKQDIAPQDTPAGSTGLQSSAQ